MAKIKRTLAEKIAIMQAINNGSTAYVQAEGVDNYVKVTDPAFNWGTSDYKAITDVTPLIENAADTTINYTELLQKLKYYERGKNLQDVPTYVTSVLNETNNSIESSISDINWTLNLDEVNPSTIGNTKLYQRLLIATQNNTTTASEYLEEFKTAITPYILSALKDNFINLVDTDINEKINNLPTDYDLYEHDAPTKEQLQAVVEALADKLAEIYPDLEDKAVVEYIDDTYPIGVRLRKDLTNGSTLTVYYYLERATSGEDEELYKASSETTDTKVKYSIVTLSELDNKAESVLSEAKEYTDSILLKANNYTDSKFNDITSTVTNEVTNSIIETDRLKTKIEETAAAKATEIANESSAQILSNILEYVYPVGILYWSSVNKDPGSILGIGTWKRITNKFILAASDPDDTNIYSVNDTGGSSQTTLTANNLPAHTHNNTVSTTINDPGHSHTIYSQNDDYNGSNVSGQTPGGLTRDAAYTSTGILSTLIVTNSKTGITATTTISNRNNTTTNTPINNMPPYIVKYCWERIK